MYISSLWQELINYKVLVIQPTALASSCSLCSSPFSLTLHRPSLHTRPYIRRSNLKNSERFFVLLSMFTVVCKY